jgi:hypothetical protein
VTVIVNEICVGRRPLRQRIANDDRGVRCGSCQSGADTFAFGYQMSERPYVVRPNLELAYSQMSKDKKRESDALEWAETTFKDIIHDKR